MAIDVRVVSATNRDLHERVAAKQFRQDLLYRLSVVTLEVPPLRRRKEDIRALVARYVRYFQARMSTTVEGFSDEALEIMEGYSWPGNVRELVNLVERCILLARGSTMAIDDLPAWLRDGSDPALLAARRSGAPADEWPGRTFREARADVVDTFEKQYFTALLRVSGGRIGEAAKRAGMTTRYLFDQLKKHGIHKAEFKY